MTKSKIVWQDAVKKLKIVVPSTITEGVFKNLQLCYECEFSGITQLKLDQTGNYDQEEIRSHWSSTWDAYIFFVEDVPAGLCVVNYGSMIDPKKSHDFTIHDIAEFFITPNFRKQKYGELFIHAIFSMYPGNWEVRQLPELADNVRFFWRKVIAQATNNNFIEINDHPNWQGFVQQFSIKSF